MKKMIVTSIFGIAFLLNGISQGFPTTHQFSHELESKIASGKLRTTSVSYFYTFIGDYHRAINSNEMPVFWGVDTVDVERYRKVPAISKIIEAAKNKRMVIISESHLKPQHRVFAKEIIDSLANYGFNHLGMEALMSDYNHFQLHDSTLNERGYPLIFKTGYYANEPQMAELIRSAIKNEYTIFGYERIKKDPNKDREEIQAENVIRYMNNSQAEKVILLCGWHHVIESEKRKGNRNCYYMAKYLKDALKTDPLTIFQDNFTEKVLNNEHKDLVNVDGVTPQVYLNADNEIARLTDHVDVEVIHPKTRYKNGRPHWLYKDATYKEYELDYDWVNIEFPLFFMAYNPGEQTSGVPVDIVEVKRKYSQKRLILNPGKYIIKVDNKEQSQEMEVLIE